MLAGVFSLAAGVLVSFLKDQFGLACFQLLMVKLLCQYMTVRINILELHYKMKQYQFNNVFQRSLMILKFTKYISSSLSALY